jgi:hypothetical protein
MIKMISGTIIGFILGMYYGIYQLVEVDDSKVVSFIKMIKGIWEVL